MWALIHPRHDSSCSAHERAQSTVRFEVLLSVMKSHQKISEARITAHLEKGRMKGQNAADDIATVEF